MRSAAVAPLWLAIQHIHQPHASEAAKPLKPTLFRVWDPNSVRSILVNNAISSLSSVVVPEVAFHGFTFRLDNNSKSNSNSNSNGNSNSNSNNNSNSNSNNNNNHSFNNNSNKGGWRGACKFLRGPGPEAGDEAWRGLDLPGHQGLGLGFRV